MRGRKYVICCCDWWENMLFFATKNQINISTSKRKAKTICDHRWQCITDQSCIERVVNDDNVLGWQLVVYVPWGWSKTTYFFCNYFNFSVIEKKDTEIACFVLKWIILSISWQMQYKKSFIVLFPKATYEIWVFS